MVEPISIDYAILPIQQIKITLYSASLEVFVVSEDLEVFPGMRVAVLNAVSKGHVVVVTNYDDKKISIEYGMKFYFLLSFLQRF